MTDTQLPTKRVVSNTAGFSSVPIEKDSLKRNGGLEIKLAAKDGPFSVNPYGDLFQPPKTWSTINPIDPDRLFEVTQECRRAWQTTLIDFTQTRRTAFRDVKSYPFQTTWDFQNQPELLEKQLGPLLAVAGETLFYLVFEDNPDPIMKDIGEVLREMTVKGEAVFTITSDNFFVPWNMIYTHPVANEKLEGDGANFKPEGFWGYQHIIEHSPRYFGLGNAIGSSSSRLNASLNIDEGIDKKLRVTAIQEQKDFFEDLDRQGIIKKELRISRKEFQAAFEKIGFADRLLYFYCHGEGADKAGEASLKSSSLRLTDGKAITKSDITYWRRTIEELTSHPLVFINACQGGQMTTLFYQTIATEFLRQKAIGLIGSQIDIPAPFAWEYARRLLSRFINSSEPLNKKVRLGPLMRDLTREFYDTHKNPLGLVYSLYRGADCYIDRSEGVASA